jgi:hypothetical protein
MSKMQLAGIVKGKIQQPPRVLVYGTEGVGKSTFAAGAPSPVFLATEDGTNQLDVARFPRADCWQDALDAVSALEGEHTYRTFVIDTLDGLEPLCWAAVCKAAGKTSIEDLGYGKGYLAALDLWRVLLARLDGLRKSRGMAIVVLAHSWIRTFRNPEAEDYDRHEMKLHAKTGGLFKEWVDCLMFARYEELVHEKAGRVRGISTGARILHTERTAAWDAKNRYNLPAELPLSWDDFAAAMVEQEPATVDALLARIDAMLPLASEDVRTKALAAVAKAVGSAAELARIADKLAAKTQGKQSQKQEEKKAS